MNDENITLQDEINILREKFNKKIKILSKVKNKKDFLKQRQELEKIIEDLNIKMEKNFAALPDIEDENRQIENKFLDYLNNLNDLLGITEIAKIYNMKPSEFNKMLEEYGIHEKKINPTTKRKEWILKPEYKNNGYKKNYFYKKTDVDGVEHVFEGSEKWTKKGYSFIFLFLKDKGVLPSNFKKELDDGFEEKLEQLGF